MSARSMTGAASIQATTSGAVINRLTGLRSRCDMNRSSQISTVNDAVTTRSNYPLCTPRIAAVTILRLDPALGVLDHQFRLLEANPDQLIDRLGERYEVSRTDIKKWTVGSPIQGPLDALEILQQRNSFEVRDVERVVVKLAPPVAAIVDNRDIPDICLQHLVAVTLLDKTVSCKAAHDKARMQDLKVLQQRAKVQLVRDESLVSFLIRLTERVEAVRGTPRNPMSKYQRASLLSTSSSLMVGHCASRRIVTIATRYLRDHGGPRLSSSIRKRHLRLS